MAYFGRSYIRIHHVMSHTEYQRHQNVVSHGSVGFLFEALALSDGIVANKQNLEHGAVLKRKQPETEWNNYIKNQSEYTSLYIYIYIYHSGLNTDPRTIENLSLPLTRTQNFQHCAMVQSPKNFNFPICRPPQQVRDSGLCSFASSRLFWKVSPFPCFRCGKPSLGFFKLSIAPATRETNNPAFKWWSGSSHTIVVFQVVSTQKTLASHFGKEPAS